MIQAPQRLRIRARRVFGDIHHIQPVIDGEGDGFLGAAQQPVERPAFGVAAESATSQ